ncbi:MAG: flippase-like domain-containing protein [Chitinophagaceae bacterium]|nr:flippase-like domain-containing protein [Chitinophagaceae bacterium]
MVFCILVVSIYRQLHLQNNWHSSLLQIHSALANGVLPIATVFCLMFANWGIEAKKWQLVLKKHSPVSFGTSYKAVFTGNALAFFTPNRVGEYFGRMLYLKSGARIASIPLTVVCSLAQIMVTLLAGGVGTMVLSDRIADVAGTGTNSWLNIGLYVTGAVVAVLTIFYFSIPFFAKRITGKKWMLHWSRHVRVLEDVNATMLLSILSLSVVRFVVFILQYYLLFGVFGVVVDWWQAFWAISVVFFVIAVVPAPGFLTELGIRWQAGLQVMQLYSQNVAGIFAVSLAVWIINLVIPALIGGILVLALKLFRKQ